MTEALNDLLLESTNQKLLVWSKKLSVGIEEFDEQHKQLIDILNQLHTAIVHKHGIKATCTLIDKLYEETRIHFSVEESLLRIFNYSGYDRHKEHHDKLLKQVLELRQKILTEDLAINFDLLHFLKKWLIIHILEEDMKYTRHLIKSGV